MQYFGGVWVKWSDTCGAGFWWSVNLRAHTLNSHTNMKKGVRDEISSQQGALEWLMGALWHLNVPGCSLLQQVEEIMQLLENQRWIYLFFVNKYHFWVTSLCISSVFQSGWCDVPALPLLRLWNELKTARCVRRHACVEQTWCVAKGGCEVELTQPLFQPRLAV